MKALHRRIQALERRNIFRPSFTWEEIYVARYQLVLAISRAKATSAFHERALDLATAMSRNIVACVSKHQQGEFLKHISEYVQPVWQERTGKLAFLPPIVGSEYDDWDVPGLYERRLAIRHFPSIVALLGPPNPEWGLPRLCLTPWRNLLAAICEAAGQDRTNERQLQLR